MKKKVKLLKPKKTDSDLLTYLHHHLGSTLKLGDAVSSKLKVQKLKKSMTISRTGDSSSDAFWLQRGYGRFYRLHVNNEGVTEDVTIDFCKPGKIIFLKEVFKNDVSEEFHFQLAAGAVIVPLEECYASVLNLTELEAARLFGKVMAMDKPESLRRMNFLQLAPRQRYRAFLEHFGAEIEQFFLGKQIACFLKMRPSYLSRIRGEFFRGGSQAITYLQAIFFIMPFV